MTFPVRETIEKRRSVRSYEPRPLEAADRAALLACRDAAANPFGVPVRIELIDVGQSDAPRRLGTYGVIRGASEFLGVAAPVGPLGLEAAGYALELVILGATHLGLGTCWLAGTLNRDAFTQAMRAGSDERMPAITPVGYPAQKQSLTERIMRGSMRSGQRKPWEALFFRSDFQTPLTEAEAGDYAEALELLRLAPSATNAQPWRVVRSDEAFHFYAVIGKDAQAADPAAIQRVDVGIAACHFHLAAQDKGLAGRFERTPTPPPVEPDGWRYLFSWVTG